MHPPSQANEPSGPPESFWVLPESSSGTAESAPLEDPPLEDPLLEELPLEELPLEELPLEEPPLDEPLPPEVASGAAPSLASFGFEALGELEEHAGARGAVTSAKLQMRADRAFMFGGKAIPMPCSSKPEMPDDRGVPCRGAARDVAPASAERARNATRGSAETVQGVVALSRWRRLVGGGSLKAAR
jgi:hypothetical protein